MTRNLNIYLLPMYHYSIYIITFIFFIVLQSCCINSRVMYIGYYEMMKIRKWDWWQRTYGLKWAYRSTWHLDRMESLQDTYPVVNLKQLYRDLLFYPNRIALLKVGLVFSNMKIIDLTDPRELLYHLEDPRAIRLATQFEEVLVEDYIHKTCFVRYIPYKPIVAGIY